MKYRIIAATVLLGAVAALSCKKDIEAVETKDNLGVVVKKQPVWQVANTADLNKSNGDILYSMPIDNAVLDKYAPAAGKSQMALVDINTGKRLWEWKDVLRDFEPISISKGSIYLYDNYLFYNYGPRNYAIDVKTGQTLWRKVTGYSINNGITYGIGPYYFVKGTPQALADQRMTEDRVYMGDIRTGKEVEVVMPRYSRRYSDPAVSWLKEPYVGRLTDVMPIVEGQDTLLLMTYDELGVLRNQWEAYIGLYNLTRKQWVYERARIKEGFYETVNSSWLTLSGDKMFTILNNAVACSNWRTGELIWFKPLPSFAAIPTPIEGKYLAVFSTDSRLFLLDIHTGQTLWQMRETLNTTDQVYYDQGILYYLTATLNAVEIPGGRKLWSIESPTSGKLDGSFWGFITGLPGKGGRKGRIFTRTGYHTYCFEAIK